MPHPSPEDPANHSTVYVKDSAGKDVYLEHVTIDKSKQQVSLFSETNRHWIGQRIPCSQLNRYIRWPTKLIGNIGLHDSR